MQTHMTTSTFVRIVTATSLFLLVSLFGCDREKQRSLIAVWQSTNSTAQAKVDAINKYIARGTDGEFVKHMLGGNTEWIHFHGGSFDTNGKAGLPVDEWLLHFPSADNQIVVLRFHQV